MILFSSKELEQALANNKLSNWDQAKYLILPAILSSPIAFLLPKISIKDLEAWIGEAYSLSWLISAFIIYYGIKKCFETNERYDSNDFLTRHVILSIPILIRLLIYITPFIIAIVLIPRSVGKRSDFSYDQIRQFLAYGFNTIMTFLYYRMLNSSYTRLGKLIKEKESNP